MPEPTPNNPDSSTPDADLPLEQQQNPKDLNEQVIRQLMTQKGFSRPQATAEVGYYS